MVGTLLLNLHRLHYLNCCIMLKINTRTIMKMRNKFRNPTTLRCNAGNRCTLSVVLWTLIGFFIMLHLQYMVKHRAVQGGGDIQLHTRYHPVFREIEEVEEEYIKVPPPRKRSPRAEKRRPRRPTTLIDEFLDESSQIRHMFFPYLKTAIDRSYVQLEQLL